MRRFLLPPLLLTSALLVLGAFAGGVSLRAGPAVARATPAHVAQDAQPSCPPAGLTTLPNGQLRMPSRTTPGTTPLLVAVMSGGDGDAGDFLHLGAVANRAGLAVLYPTGRAGGIWQINDAFGSSDVTLVGGLLDGVLASGCFDLNRLSIVGVSNGGGFATRMACKLQSRFAAVISVAAGYRALDPCVGTRGSFLAIHGGADTIVPFAGRPPNHRGGVLRYASDWAHRDGCTTLSVASPRPFESSFDFGHCTPGMKVEVLLLRGTDHGWPGAPPPFPTRNPSGVDANADVVGFALNSTLHR
ncbi:MAG TPA: hypothetical protein VII98_07475 [Solirubrobacteraceae bacterium]